MVLVGVGIAVFVVLLVILVVGLLLWRGACARKKVPKDKAYNTEAHDNPIYMETPGQTQLPQQTVPEEPIYSTLAGATRTSVSSRESDLPDVVITKEGLSFPPDMDDDEHEKGAVGVEDGDDALVVKSDKEQLMASEEVMLNIQDLDEIKVGYTAQQ